MKATCKTFWIFFCSLALLMPFQAPAQDQHAVVQAKLSRLYTLTTMSADGSEIVNPGSILVLHKDGLKLCSVQAHVPLTNNYKGGKLSAGVFKWTMEMSMVQSDMPPAQVPQKRLDSGEKIWVTAVAAGKGGVTLKVFSDPYADLRYWGQIEIPFEKGRPEEEVLDRLAQVVTIDAPVETAAIPAPGSGAADAAAASVNDPKQLLKQKLDSVLVLTQGDINTGEIATPGSIVALRREGLVLWTIEDQVRPNYTYQSGKISLHLMDWGRAQNVLQAKDPNLTPRTIPQHKVAAGEKVWVMDSRVRDNGVLLTFMSDAYDNVRYIGDLWFPFEKKQSMPTGDDFMKTLAEVVAVEPPPASTQTASVRSPGAADPSPVPPAPMAPIAPPPPPPKTIVVGQTRDEVLATLGAPPRKASLGAKEIYYYPDRKITLVNGKVKEIQ